MATCYGWDSCLKVKAKKPLQGGTLLFNTKIPEIPGTHLINLGRMKNWVDLEATHWFSTQDSWIGNPVS